MEETTNNDVSYLDRGLIGEVSEAILLSSNKSSLYKSGFVVGGSSFYKGSLLEPEFCYRLKQALDVYWEDDSWAGDCYYQQAEELIYAGTDILHRISSLDNKKKETRFEILRRVNRAREILDGTNYLHLRLDELAKDCMMSKFFLIRSFKKVFHTTPQKYLITRKIRMARELLGAGVRAKAVAQKLGYPDLFSFSKQFKKHSGVSPSMFRIG